MRLKDRRCPQNSTISDSRELLTHTRNCSTRKASDPEALARAPRSAAGRRPEDVMATSSRARRIRKSSDEGSVHSDGRTSGEKVELLVDKPDKYQNMRKRFFSSTLMVAGFAFVVWMGHVYIWAMIVVIQILMVRELFSLARNAHREIRLPWFRTLNWLFFVTGVVFVYGRFLNRQLSALLHGRPMVAFFEQNHMLICYSLYIVAFVWFILSLQKGLYQYQFRQYAWTHMILFTVFAQSSFTVANIFEGIIWFLLPCCLIIVNDCAAYIFGFYLGRTPLIKLSPKKTWEGFIGASVTTIISAFWLARVMGQSQWMTCPRRDLDTGWLECNPGPMFVDSPLPSRLQALFGRDVRTMPVQWHALVLGVFASIVAPFGGFFASGFKRAFKIKDFGDSIPGHGGITDRMDCQMVMAVFAYVYYQSISSSRISVQGLLDKASALTIEQQKELYELIGMQLVGALGENFSGSSSSALRNGQCMGL